MNSVILVIDFLSHKNMHLPFNEGYLKTLCFAFPDKKIIFAADSEHTYEMSKSFVNNNQITFKNITSLKQALKGHSEHNPFYSLPAATACWNETLKILDNQIIEQLIILGAASSLINIFSKYWKRSQNGKLFFVQHNQLSSAKKWRSVNPVFRYFDYISTLKRGLPQNQTLLTLELGLEDVITEIAPKMIGSTQCIEHPVLESEWVEPQSYAGDRPLKVGFTGHCGRGKGLDTFIALAKQFTGHKFEFHAIGKLNESNASDLDTSILKTEPQRTHVERDEFLNKLRQMDIICLPLPNTTSYVSSGSIIDAFAALKPLIMTKNQSLDAIEKKYGEFGVLTQSTNNLITFFEQFDVASFQQKHHHWIENLKAIRTARSEKILARNYSSNHQS